ncbi:PilZ domain-containing protein [Pseudocolwellia agarivorans]|uniref:PilZ domain-containing protein n=1 Tax=Pseudocolwellia agarivorans TaxID=1911682 RepID=UPI00098489B1|nr:PilZ domain-containing protein [Pseudocolwellia agarivorans]
MPDEHNNLKLNQYNEFFSIDHDFNINAKRLNNGKTISYNDFLKDIPTPFKLVNDIASLDRAAMAPLGVVTGVAGQLVQYLNIQAQKIDLLINHMLNEQDDENQRYQGVAFGGAGIEFIHDTAFSLNEFIEIKIFLTHENCAIYCHAEVIQIESAENQYHHKVIFHHIRDDDRERLVRSSLHLQSKQLQQLAKQRNKQPNE